MVKIETYKEEYKERIVALILDIQQNEFGVPVTINDQPDLLDIENFYRVKNGNFWVAIENDNVVGTIALIDIGKGQSALRKMFVHKEYRGRQKGTGQLLMDTVIEWCRQKAIAEIYLGTIDVMIAAQKFYRRNGFEVIDSKVLPGNFPVMKVDNLFFKLTIIGST